MENSRKFREVKEYLQTVQMLLKMESNGDK